MFDDFFGNGAVASTLEQMIEQERIPQTLLLAGPEGVGKATLARRFAARLLGDTARIGRDDLSLEHNVAMIAERERWPSERRAEEPLLVASHPDFVTFPPDGPLRQVSIQQMRLLKERAQFKPSRGRYRVFLIDHLDRANEQAANSLLKTLEEPPEHLILLLTAENPYDLLPTIRSRAILFHMTPLGAEEMLAFVRARALDEAGRRIALASGSPGLAVSIDLEAYDRRREAMMALLEAAAGRAGFSVWAKHSETISASKQEKLDYYLGVLYSLLEDLLVLSAGDGSRIRNADIQDRLAALAAEISFAWLKEATRRVDEMAAFVRRNIQKSIALDAFALALRAA